MSLHDRRDLTQAARGAVTAKAAFILDEATALGIHVGTDGTELVMLAPMRVPREVRVWFEKKIDEYRAEIIDFIRRENAPRTGATP